MTSVVFLGNKLYMTEEQKSLTYIRVGIIDITELHMSGEDDVVLAAVGHRDVDAAREPVLHGPLGPHDTGAQLEKVGRYRYHYRHLYHGWYSRSL